MTASPHASPREPRFDPALAAILGLALLLRGGVLLVQPGIGLWFDEILHFASGVITAHFGPTVVGHWGPAYDGLLALVFRSFGPEPLAVRWVQVGLSTATVAAVYGIAAAAGGRRAARIAAGLTAVSPSLVAFSHYLYAETLFAALVCAGLYALVAPRRGAGFPAGAAVAGVCFGAAALTRSSIVYYLPLWSAWLWWRGDREALRRSLVALAAAAATLAPWTARNALVYGDFLLVDGTAGHSLHLAYGDRERPFNIDLGYGLDPDPERELPCAARRAPGRRELPPTGELLQLFPGPPAIDARARRRLPHKIERVRGFAVQDTPAVQRCELRAALERVSAAPGRALRDSFRRLYAFWGPNSFLLRSLWRGAYEPALGRDAYRVAKWALAVGHVLLLGLALLALARRELPLPARWIAGFALYTSAAHAATVAFSRYRMPLLPLCAVLAALWLAAPERPRGARGLAAAGALLALLATSGHYVVWTLP